MSDSASKYLEKLEDKAYWAQKELEKTEESRFARIMTFICNLRNLKIKIEC